jgi:hypothetical protein
MRFSKRLWILSFAAYIVTIDQETNEELREALQDLDDFLFGY